MPRRLRAASRMEILSRAAGKAEVANADVVGAADRADVAARCTHVGNGDARCKCGEATRHAVCAVDAATVVAGATVVAAVAFVH